MVKTRRYPRQRKSPTTVVRRRDEPKGFEPPAKPPQWKRPVTLPLGKVYRDGKLEDQ